MQDSNKFHISADNTIHINVNEAFYKHLFRKFLTNLFLLGRIDDKDVQDVTKATDGGFKFTDEEEKALMEMDLDVGRIIVLLSEAQGRWLEEQKPECQFRDHSKDAPL